MGWCLMVSMRVDFCDLGRDSAILTFTHFVISQVNSMWTQSLLDMVIF